MASIIEKIALCIGVQGSRTAVNTSVRDATGMIVAAATGTDGTGIFLRKAADLSMDFDRIESEGGTFTGLEAHASRVSGSFKRIDANLVFTIDVRGNGVATGTPDSGDFDQDEYLLRILGMNGFDGGTPSSSDTKYAFSGTQVYATIKVWRNGESFTLVGCRCDLSYSFPASEVGRLTVTVHNDTVIHDSSDTFPVTAAATAYGTQIDNSPVFQLAISTLDGDSRGFQAATLAISYVDQEFKDCNLADGVVTDAGRRTVAFSGNYVVDSGQSAVDYAQLSEEFDSGTAPILAAVFNCGQAAGAGVVQNAFKFDIPNLRITKHAKVDAANLVRTLAGYAVIAGSSGDGSADQEELVISGV